MSIGIVGLVALVVFLLLGAAVVVLGGVWLSDRRGDEGRDT